MHKTVVFVFAGQVDVLIIIALSNVSNISASRLDTRPHLIPTHIVQNLVSPVLFEP